MKRTRWTVPAAIFCAVAAVPAVAEEAASPTFTPYADIRYRLELVDQDGLAQEATASTLRLRAGLKTSEWYGFSALVEGEVIAPFGSRRYNDTVNGKVAYPVVADPTDVVLNQAWLRWRPDPMVELTAGRQTINIDNQRWVGSVGWRQNDQTLDAARVTVKPAAGLVVDYLHSWRVNRVFGPDSAQGIWRDTSINGARAAYTIKGIGTVSTYGYWLDIPAAPAASSRTLGLRIAGEQPVGNGTRLLYTAEYARQHDFAGNPANYSLDYLAFEPGIASGPMTLKLGFERLEGNGVVALQTPLATLHAFNGWADKFLTTPANGLRDGYADAGYKFADGPLKGLQLRLAWHDFRSTRAGIDYGSEWNALASYPIDKRLTLTAKFASYRANQFATDTTKAWFQLEGKF